MERWLQIDEFPVYSVSDQGRVRNDYTGRIMTLLTNDAGVVVVYLVRDGKQSSRGVAKLVATHFLPHNTNDIFDTPMHLDGDRTNNAAENLIWRPRWYAFKYHQQFDRYRRPYVDCPIIETQTGTIFANSWEATVTLGILETDIAHSFHAYQGRGETIPAHPTIYCFRRLD
jgi:hypothetical protein